MAVPSYRFKKGGCSYVPFFVSRGRDIAGYIDPMPDPNRTIEYGVAHRDEGATGGAASHVIGLLAMLIGAVTLWEASWHFLSNLACALGVVLAGICISGIVSSIRGMLTARYRRRAILGLVATAAATFLGLAALGRMLSGLH